VDDWPRGFDLIPQTQPGSALATAAGAQNIGHQNDQSSDSPSKKLQKFVYRWTLLPYVDKCSYTRSTGLWEPTPTLYSVGGVLEDKNEQGNKSIGSSNISRR